MARSILDFDLPWSYQFDFGVAFDGNFAERKKVSRKCFKFINTACKFRKTKKFHDDFDNVCVIVIAFYGLPQRVKFCLH